MNATTWLQAHTHIMSHDSIGRVLLYYSITVTVLAWKLNAAHHCI